MMSAVAYRRISPSEASIKSDIFGVLVMTAKRAMRGWASLV